MRDIKAKFDYASLLVKVPDELTAIIAAFNKTLLADEVLIDGGRETSPHITVKYGLLVKTSDAVAALLRYQNPFQVVLGGVDIFTSSPDYNVVVVKVHSIGIINLNRLVRHGLPHINTFPRYLPHLTLGYVRKDVILNFTENEQIGLAGIKFLVNNVWFSTPDDKLTEIPLGLPSS